MGDYVVVQPVAGREAAALTTFQTGHHVELYNPDGSGEKKTETLDRKNGTLIDAVDERKPIFVSKRGQFVFIDKDGEVWDQAKFTALCKELRLRYPDWHPDGGKVIEECDMKNPDDAFLNNSYWRYRLEEGGMQVSTKDPSIGPKVDMFRGDPEFTQSRPGAPISGNARYHISSPEDTAKTADKRVASATKAWELFLAAKDDKARLEDILVAIGVEVGEDEPLSKLAAAAMSYAQDDTTTEQGVTKQALWLRYATLPPGELRRHKAVVLAVRRDVIMYRGGVYEYGGTSLGTSVESVKEFFKRADNASQYNGLLIRLGIKEE